MNISLSFLKSIRVQFILVFVLFFHDSFGVGSIVLEKRSNDIEVGGELISIYRDSTGTMSLRDVISANGFEVNRKKFPTNTDPSSAYWLRFVVKTRDIETKNWLLEVLDPHIDEVELYESTAHGIVKRSLGQIKRFEDRDYQHKNFLFDIHLQPNTQKTFYVKIKSWQHVNFMLRLQTDKFFTFYSLNEYYLLGIYYGILIIMAIYNLLLFFSTREKVYLFYVAYVLSIGVNSLLEDGTGFQYIWPESPVVTFWLWQLSSPLILISFVFYSNAFLEISKRYRSHAKLILWATLAYLFVYFLELAFNINLQAVLFYFVPMLAIYFTAYKIYKDGYKPSIYFMTGFSAVLIALLVLFLRQHGIIQTNFIPSYLDIVLVYALNISFIIEIVILSLALGERIKFLKSAKEIAQQETILQLEEKERLKDKINLELEQKVAERTSELKEKNKNIIESINYAKRIQDASLPDEKNLKKHLPTSFLFHKAKDIVSGDFFWTEKVGNKVYIAAVDCTGHGVPGAFMSLLGNNLLNYAIVEKGLSSTDEILNTINRKLQKSFEQDKMEINDQYGMSMGLMAIDGMEVEYSGAFIPLYIERKGVLEEVAADRYPLGHYFFDSNDHNFGKTTITLNSSDTLYLSSDGFQDQFNEKGEKYMKDRFKELLHKLSKEPIEEQKMHLEKELETWKGDREQLDDILVVGISIG